MIIDKFEIWKDIKGYENQYQISNLGRVKSLDREIIKNNGVIQFRTGIFRDLNPNEYGYNSISLCKNNKTKGYMVHRLVAQAFIPNPENKLEVNHKNGIKTDNRIENLEWMTPKENTRHAHKNKFVNTAKGERNHKSKLTEKEILEIRRDYRKLKGRVWSNSKELSEKYNISQPYLWKIIKRITWKHI